MQVVEFDTNDAQRFLERARFLYAVKQDHPRALREVRKALTRLKRGRSARFDALRLQGRILGALDRDRDAVASYRAALKINPRDMETRASLGRSLLLGGKPKAALRYLEESIRALEGQQTPDPFELALAFEFTAKALTRLDRHKEALQALDRGIRRVVRRGPQAILRELRDRIAATQRS